MIRNSVCAHKIAPLNWPTRVSACEYMCYLLTLSVGLVTLLGASLRQ